MALSMPRQEPAASGASGRRFCFQRCAAYLRADGLRRVPLCTDKADRKVAHAPQPLRAVLHLRCARWGTGRASRSVSSAALMQHSSSVRNPPRGPTGSKPLTS